MAGGPHLTLRQARRLAVAAQQLSGPRPAATGDGLTALVRRLGCLQLDPTAVVARSHELVVWSRVGRFDPALLARLQHPDRVLFEYWAHEASLVMSEDLPIFRWRMGAGPGTDKVTERRARRWLNDNRTLIDALVDTLREHGPLRTKDLRHFSVAPWPNGGWSDAPSVALLLEVLSLQGIVLVSYREGGQRWWDLAERCLPAAPVEEIDRAEAVRRATLRSIGALGVATQGQITRHFTRRAYPGLADTLRSLVATGEIVACTVEGQSGAWYAKVEDLENVAVLPPARTTLLSPFDNLICDRDRTEALWGFRFRLEIYTPAAKRAHGYFVMPVLSGDRLCARVDVAVDRRRSVLQVLSTHVEPGAKWTRSMSDALDRLAAWSTGVAGPAEIYAPEP